MLNCLSARIGSDGADRRRKREGQWVRLHIFWSRRDTENIFLKIMQFHFFLSQLTAFTDYSPHRNSVFYAIFERVFV